ncbi:MAG: hypothetical protein BGN86_00225 [Caulobacterales bacterium 68-7]|nr:septal ring lytic transglycosylase RlpA family protein [Caulobacterales bacterium]OJU12879.1 MAG: hypothetical protein BGN86_00225 [Caulobacterales bacterium 68-7]
MRQAARWMRSGTVAVLASAGLAACATPMATRMPSSGVQASRPPSGGANTSGARIPGTMRPYQIRGQWYYPAEDPDYNEVGIGSWYGEQFHNRTTSNGEIFDMDRITAAHKTLPLPSLVEVTNLDNGRKLVIRVNDRGPFVDGRIIDLSRAGAEALGYRQSGVAKVRVRYIGPAPKSPFDGQRLAEAKPAPLPPPPALQPYAPPPAPTPTYVAVAQLPPAAPASSPMAGPPLRFPLANAGVYRVQAGAFANRDNAERAVAMLGQAVIEPTTRDGVEIYRVILGPAADEPAAWALRDLAASQGFVDARVLRP